MVNIFRRITWKLCGSISKILVKVNMKLFESELVPSSLFQEIDVYPKTIFPFSFLYKQRVAPWLLHLSWKILLVGPSLVPL